MHTKLNPISYRDTAARVHFHNGKYYRIIFEDYSEEYQHLMLSGLYTRLIHDQLLIQHKEIDNCELNLGDLAVYKILLPDQIMFISRPEEWTRSQIFRATITYLRINAIALEFGMILKDASFSNFYFKNGRPVLFDTSSFEFYNKNWKAYNQFCRFILGPTLLLYYNFSFFKGLTKTIDLGLDLSEISQSLHYRSWFNLDTLIHIHIHSYFEIRKRSSIEIKNQQGFNINQVKFIIERLIKTLERKLGKLSRSTSKSTSVWKNYYQENFVGYDENRSFIVDKILSGYEHGNLIIDLGCNLGKYSRIAIKYSHNVVSIDNDYGCLESLSAMCLQENLNITTVFADLSNPTSSSGYLNLEKPSLINRIKNADTIIALAIIHHLYFTNNMTLEMIAYYFKVLNAKQLVIEFVPKNDPMVKILSNFKHNSIIESYNEERFELSMKEYFTLRSKNPIGASTRKIYSFSIRK